MLFHKLECRSILTAVLPLKGPFITFNWNAAPVEVHAGERGEAHWKTQTYGDVRVREVRYTPGYIADHWCRKGHVLYVLDGTLTTELEDGSEVTLSRGESYTVPDDVMAHRSRTDGGALLFIVD